MISPGVARLTWTVSLQAEGVTAASEEVRRVVSEGFAAGHHRIEVYIDPEDTTAQRVATFSGLMNEGIARGAAIALHDVEDAGRNARVDGKLRQAYGGKWRHFGRLEHHGIARSQSGAHFP